ncbi:MAG TPA: YdeI/OmpD-associated family protein [Methanocella sp.]|nr:YdeI/OmpD-associated family protein [Methanocella sp.]
MAHDEQVSSLSETVYCATRQEWRDWLELNHESTKEIWLIYYKKSSNIPRISYDDAVEEAICFGWIDTTVRTIDKDRYAQKYTPRNSRSRWSEINVARAEKMITEGLMTEAGMKRFRDRRMAQQLHEVDGNGELIIPTDLLEALKADDAALGNFNRFTPSQRKLFIRWINDAKRPETRQRRISEATAMLSKNIKMGAQ